jgi:hypothetical protein
LPTGPEVSGLVNTILVFEILPPIKAIFMRQGRIWRLTTRSRLGMTHQPFLHMVCHFLPIGDLMQASLENTYRLLSNINLIKGSILHFSLFNIWITPLSFQWFNFIILALLLFGPLIFWNVLFDPLISPILSFHQGGGLR